MFSEIFVEQKEEPLVIEEMYDPNQLLGGSKFKIENCELVVIYNGIEMVMTRDEVIRISPRALIEWYERNLINRGQK
jgi:hypothetical protein